MGVRYDYTLRMAERASCEPLEGGSGVIFRCDIFDLAQLTPGSESLILRGFGAYCDIWRRRRDYRIIPLKHAEYMVSSPNCDISL